MMSAQKKLWIFFFSRWFSRKKIDKTFRHSRSVKVSLWQMLLISLEFRGCRNIMLWRKQNSSKPYIQINRPFSSCLALISPSFASSGCNLPMINCLPVSIKQKSWFQSPGHHIFFISWCIRRNFPSWPGWPIPCALCTVYRYLFIHSTCRYWFQMQIEVEVCLST
jgi:hypothetical protein